MPDNQMTVVTGAGGFIGGHLVASLRRKGVTNIRAMDIKPFDEWYQVFDDVENLYLDLNLKENCEIAAKGGRDIYNLAANMGGMGFIENNKALCMLSVLINTHLLMAAAKRASSASSIPPPPVSTTATSRSASEAPSLKEEDAYPALAGRRLWLGKTLLRAHVPAFPRRLRVCTPRGALPQCLRPVGHLVRRPRKGPGGHLPQSHRSQDSLASHEIEIWGRRRPDPQLHVHRRLPPGHPAIMDSDILEPINLGSSEPVTHQPACGHRRGYCRHQAEAQVRSDRSQRSQRPQQRQHADPEISRLGTEHPLSVGLEKTYRWIYDEYRARGAGDVKASTVSSG